MDTAVQEPKKKSRSLFDIGLDFERLEDLLAETQGDISDPEVEKFVMQWMESLHQEQATKLDHYVNFIRKQECEAAAAKEEAERYAKSAKVRSNRVDRLKTLMKEFLERTKQQKLVTATGRTVRFQNNGGLAPLIFPNVVTPESVDEKFRRTTITVSIDNEKVRAHLEAGEKLEWAMLGQRGTSLRIQ